MMSAAAEEETDVCCANCGAAEIDDTKLEDCPHCDRAKYCGDECQQNHLEIHEAICKERTAELREEILFRQPEGTDLGDCPICFLPMPLDASKSKMNSCCGKLICNGCNYANDIRELKERLKSRCPFCRKPIPKTEEEARKNNKKRAAANDPVALRKVGDLRYKAGDYGSAFEYSMRAAELGDAVSHYNLSCLYQEGQGVKKDRKMETYHFEEAAIAGHPVARHNLGWYEYENKRYDRAMKHFTIAAYLGYDKSLQALKECYKGGLVSKDDLAKAFRAHQAAVDATKSPQREAAAKYHEEMS